MATRLVGLYVAQNDEEFLPGPLLTWRTRTNQGSPDSRYCLRRRDLQTQKALRQRTRIVGHGIPHFDAEVWGRTCLDDKSWTVRRSTSDAATEIHPRGQIARTLHNISQVCRQ